MKGVIQCSRRLTQAEIDDKKEEFLISNRKACILKLAPQGNFCFIEPSEEMFEDRQIEKTIYAQTGVIPHDTLRYRFLALNELAKIIPKISFSQC